MAQPAQQEPVVFSVCHYLTSLDSSEFVSGDAGLKTKQTEHA